MPVLEAMASGLPVIHTAGGPTDEFCPPEAGWRIRSRRQPIPGGRVDRFETVGEPWMLEPDPAHLAELLREAAAAGADERARRGALGRSAALHFGWDRVAALYGERARALAARAPRPLAPERELDGAPAVLATPAWNGTDDLAGAAAGVDASAARGLPVSAGRPGHRRRARRARGACDGRRGRASTSTRAPTSRSCASTPCPGATRPCTRAAELYVPLHAGCAGHVRLAGAKAATPAELGIRLAARPAAHAA